MPSATLSENPANRAGTGAQDRSGEPGTYWSIRNAGHGVELVVSETVTVYVPVSSVSMALTLT